MPSQAPQNEEKKEFRSYLVEVTRVVRSKDYEPKKPGSAYHTSCFAMARPVGWKGIIKFNGFADKTLAQGDVLRVNGDYTQEKYTLEGREHSMIVLENAHARHIAPEQVEAEKAKVMAKIAAHQAAKTQETPAAAVEAAAKDSPVVEEESNCIPGF